MASRGIPPSLLSLLWRWLPAAAWMAVIFGGSTDVLSAAHTSRWGEPFLRWLLGAAASPAAIEQVHFLLRKAGHVGEYAVLAALLGRALRPVRSSGAPPPGAFATSPAAPWIGPAGGLALGLAAAFAAGDEFHQAFVPTRGASAADVCLDSAGALLGLLGRGWWRRRRGTG